MIHINLQYTLPLFTQIREETGLFAIFDKKGFQFIVLGGNVFF